MDKIAPNISYTRLIKDGIIGYKNIIDLDKVYIYSMYLSNKLIGYVQLNTTINVVVYTERSIVVDIKEYLNFSIRYSVSDEIIDNLTVVGDIENKTPLGLSLGRGLNKLTYVEIRDILYLKITYPKVLMADFSLKYDVFIKHMNLVKPCKIINLSSERTCVIELKNGICVDTNPRELLLKLKE